MRHRLAVSLGATLFFWTGLSVAQPVPAQPVPEPAQPAPVQPPPPQPAPPEPATHAAPPPGTAPPAPTPIAQPIAPAPAPEPKREGEPGDEAAAKPLAGWHGVFFLRDAKDTFRLYPRARLHVDFNGFAGPGVTDVSAADGGTALKARLFARRLRFELAGDAFHFVDFLLGVDFGGQPITNANGKTETAAGAAGKDPTADSARFAPIQSVSAAAAVANTWVNIAVAPELNFMIGQDQAPFSLENRTNENTHTWMERNLAIRGFAFPNAKEIGVTAWGDIGDDKVLSYEGGVFAGDGQNRPQVDNRADFMGRVWTRPLASSKGSLKRLQIGASAHHGDRDPDYVGYDYPAITTGSGFALWNPVYKDSFGRSIHILPSGAQNEIGGELLVPVGPVQLASEAYYVVNNTREAVDGFQLTNTERLGRVKGIGWYVQLSAWSVGDAYVNGDLGMVRPTHVDLTKPVEIKKGLEVFGIVAGVQADYDGASRGGAYDAKTPGTGNNASKINIFEYGLGATYWYTKNFRTTVNYILYHTPGSSSSDNLALVPGNLGTTPNTDAHVLHEIGARLHVSF